MNRKLTLLLMLLPAILFAQDPQGQKFGITFSGYVKTDFMLDSRQTFAAREGHFLLWPMPITYDANNLDLNDGYNTNFLPIQSQLSGKITAPDFFGAKVTGVLEGDFFGITNADINLLRLRHAYSKLTWSHFELLTGQYWHPLFNASCFPATVSFNTGAPISPFSRDPQIRGVYTSGKFRLGITAVEQRDYPSYGPAGASSAYLRNAMIPELYGEFVFTDKCENNNAITTGVIFGTKTIVPRLESKVGTKTYKVSENISSIAGSVFVNLKLRPVTIKVTGLYGENLADVLSTTGYAVVAVTDTITGEQKYAPTSSMILWTDIHTNGTKWQAGIFAGVNRSLGTTEPMSDPQAAMYGLTYNNKFEIPLIWRVSPRVIYNLGKTRFAAEIEYTSATFGTANSSGVILRDNNGMPLNTQIVNNLRFLLGAYIFF
jgi:hypothetical protein